MFWTQEVDFHSCCCFMMQLVEYKEHKLVLLTIGAINTALFNSSESSRFQNIVQPSIGECLGAIGI